MKSENEKDFVICAQDKTPEFYCSKLRERFPNCLVEIANDENIVFTAELIDSIHEIGNHKKGIKEIPRDPLFF